MPLEGWKWNYLKVHIQKFWKSQKKNKIPENVFKFSFFAVWEWLNSDSAKQPHPYYLLLHWTVHLTSQRKVQDSTLMTPPFTVPIPQLNSTVCLVAKPIPIMNANTQEHSPASINRGASCCCVKELHTCPADSDASPSLQSLRNDFTSPSRWEDPVTARGFLAAPHEGSLLSEKHKENHGLGALSSIADNVQRCVRCGHLTPPQTAALALQRLMQEVCC